MKPLTGTRTINALIGDEKQEKEEKNETESLPPSQLPWTIRSLPTILQKYVDKSELSKKIKQKKERKEKEERENESLIVKR